jgi:hypothetical protein
MGSYYLILILFLPLLASSHPTVVNVVSGELNFKLSCPSMPPLKELHSVLWLVGEVAIGAEADYDHSKYRYLASTGQLMLKVTYILLGEFI